MSVKKSARKAEENANQLIDDLPEAPSDKQVTEQQIESSYSKKLFHQFFTLPLFSIFLVVAVLLSSSLWLLTQQLKHTQTLTTEQLPALKSQLLQQTYLINLNELLRELLHTDNPSDIVKLQQALTLQSKKLSLLKSKYKSDYQQWFNNNDKAVNLVIGIADNYSRHELLKNNSLIQLDTLLDAINIELGGEQVSANQEKLLNKVKNQLSNIVITLKSLSLLTPVTVIESLSHQIDEMFVEDYARQLANQQTDNQSVSDIVRDFIRFEDLILKHGLLLKWQAQLSLMADYQKQLHLQEQQVKHILASIVKTNLEGKSVPKVSDDEANFAINIKLIKEAVQLIPPPIWIFYTVILCCIIGLLFVVRARLKTVNKVNINLIERAIQSEKRSLLTKGNNTLIQNEVTPYFCAETEELIKSIEQVNTGKYTESMYLALSEKNNRLTEQLAKVNVKADELTDKTPVFESDCLIDAKTASSFEYQRFITLYTATIKQLVLLGESSISANLNLSNNKNIQTQNNYLFEAYIQGRDLAKQLKRAAYYNYLLSDGAVLTLNNVNIIAEINVVLLNLQNTLLTSNNTVSIDFDNKINLGVTLDVEFFAELFNAFICLLLTEQTNKHLMIRLSLVDKNNGQQKIEFVGQLQVNGNNKSQLPKALQSFSSEISNEVNEQELKVEIQELGRYFSTLLSYQHGDVAMATSTDEFYQFSFSLPLAVTDEQFTHSQFDLSFPASFPEISQTFSTFGCKYLTMPIEVLLAVKSPEKYQALQYSLQSLGLQTCFVNNEYLLQKYWQSGRFAVLITELPCKPFTTFLIDDPMQEQSNKSIDVSRGVFSLNRLSIKLEDKSQNPSYSHWFTGELSVGSSIDEVITTMEPWITTLQRLSATTNRVTELESAQTQGFIKLDNPTPLKQIASFDFNRYLKHQGSAELALFMLDEYTTENGDLITDLHQVFLNNETEKAGRIIQALLDNSKILAADYLLSLCQQWQTLLANQALNNLDEMQIMLLNNTKAAVQAISEHAVSIA
ncbi:hypothetical protein [Colwellia echini]|uniref:Uncharacterized protein n=1 Tax=Colwellia echini TaxID=1982103 RepID=A0ABY3MZ91_9GAMM|nr:hypothetical protein [Colwellia echini]TYK66520.1 hypothetical protein CWS31_004050 [Colwellia echini]